MDSDDKLLFTHTSRMETFMGTNVDSVVYGSKVRSVSGTGCSNDNVSDGHVLNSLSGEYNRHISTIFGNIINSNNNLLSTLVIEYITYFYSMFPIHLNNFYHLFIHSTQPQLNGLISLKTEFHKLNDIVNYFITNSFRNSSLFSNNYINLKYDLNLYTTYYFIISFVHYSINEFKSNFFLYDQMWFYYDILGILSTGIRGCCCICSYECCNKKCNSINTGQFKGVNYHLNFYLRNMSDNHGNNLCLCIVTKYLLFGNVSTLNCYMIDIVADFYSSFRRRFDKYTHSTTHVMSVGKVIMLLIKVIHKLTLWMKLNYLCSCPPNCPCCCPTKGGDCRCQCKVCSQPAVTCCTCPSKPNNCTTNRNNNCCCKCSKKNEQPCSSCCSGRCTSNGCCRCCCNCFCKNHNDPWYPYLISIILYVSSLIENIWSMDIESMRVSIVCLSSLLAEYQSLDDKSHYTVIEPLELPKMSMRLSVHNSGTVYPLPWFLDFQIDINYTISLLGDMVSIWFKFDVLELDFHPIFILAYNYFFNITFSLDNILHILKKSFNLVILGIHEIISEFLLIISKVKFKSILKDCDCNKKCGKKLIMKTAVQLMYNRCILITKYISKDMRLDTVIPSSMSKNITINKLNHMMVKYTRYWMVITKNNLITHPNYGSNYITISNTGTDRSNWGYDTKYEHDVTNDNSIIRSDGYPDISNKRASYGSGSSNKRFKMIVSRMLVGGVIVFVFMYLRVSYQQFLVESRDNSESYVEGQDTHVQDLYSSIIQICV